MGFKFILSLIVVLSIICLTKIQPEPKLPPFWYGPEYKDILENLKANGFTNAEIDSMFYAADSGRTKFLKEQAEKERFRQIFKFMILRTCPYIPKSTLGSILRKTLGEWEDTKLLSKESINDGKQFLKDHQSSLLRVEKQYGVQKEIITAIVRIETAFGNNLGQYHVFSVFDSIICSVDTSTKARKFLKKWIKEEMVALFIICRNNKLDISQMVGSRIGAIGLAQFMPTSYLTLAVDGNNDRIVNLFEWDDALASIAHYLKQAGWRRNNSTEVNKKAIYIYNRSWNYTNSVIKYARAIGFKK